MMQRYLALALLGITLLGTQANAQSDLYLGVDLFQSYNSFDVYTTDSGSFDYDNDSDGFKAKLGVLTYDGWRVQGYYLYERFDEPLFDPNNDELSEMGVDLIKSFGTGRGIAPFIQGGFGIGWMDLDPAYYADDSISEFSLKFGAGMFIWLSPALDAVVGADLQYRGWEDVRDDLGRIETEDTSARLYVGLNVYF
jgi:hypothetical protein